MGNSRLKNSALNLATGLMGRMLTIILNFAVRTIFIHCLDEAYLSVNGLYSNILTVLSLAELGFGSAMVYRMYEPMAKHDYKKVAELLSFYKRIYFVVGMTIVAMGLCVIPFMDDIIKDKPDVPCLTLYYIIFLLNSGLSYCFAACKGTLFSADQKEYIQTNVRNVVAIIQAVLQVLLLLLFRAYLCYLLIQLEEQFV